MPLSALPPIATSLPDYRAMEDTVLAARIGAVRQQMGPRLVILGHHYQQDGVIAHADLQGDSYQLSKSAAERSTCEAIVFCGVHFMAESADVLTTADQKVILPDLAAGCSMADMASANQVDDCWNQLTELGIAPKTIPVTYMNSSAAIKSFTGKNGGTICTSSNAKSAMEWAFTQGDKVLFLPDQHLGRNTAVLSMGLSLTDCVVWNPWKPMGGLTEAELRAAKVILWRGHCSVHGRFTAQNVADVRERVPGVQVLVHPECQHEVVSIADVVGSTEKIIQTVKNSPAGSKWAIGTELNLVQRLSRTMPDKEILFLDKTVCYCSTMNRIDLPHLVWAMESLVQGQVVNQIIVPEEVRKYSKLALERMLAL